jgi:hypothetical protein
VEEAVMKARGLGRWVTLAVLVGVIVPAAGCGNYLKNRGDDFRDIWEFGYTTSEQPEFATYFGLTHGLTLGYTAQRLVTVHGFANNHWGRHQMRDDSVGWLFIGTTSHVVATGEMTIPETDPPQYQTNILGLGFGRSAAGPKMAWDCPAILHYGRIGLLSNFKSLEALDFFLGLFTLDIMEDDNQVRPANYLRQ